MGASSSRSGRGASSSRNGRGLVLERLRRGCHHPERLCALPLQTGSPADIISLPKQPPCATITDANSTRVAYVLLSSPFSRAGRSQGLVREDEVLRMHLHALAATASLISHLFVMVPSDSARDPTWESRVSGDYLDILTECRFLPFPATLIRIPNNTLGSYGMYLSAFAMLRERFDYYIFAEDDYVPVWHSFDAALLSLYTTAFGRGVGVISGLLQGRPTEPTSPYLQHCESSHIMSAATLRCATGLDCANEHSGAAKPAWSGSLLAWCPTMRSHALIGTSSAALAPLDGRSTWSREPCDSSRSKVSAHPRSGAHRTADRWSPPASIASSSHSVRCFATPPWRRGTTRPSFAHHTGTMRRLSTGAAPSTTSPCRRSASCSPPCSGYSAAAGGSVALHSIAFT